MRKIALISSFCDTEEKISVLLNNLKMLKEIGVDSLLISPFPLTKEILDNTTYFFKTNDNPVLDWPLRAMYAWREIYIKGETYRISKTNTDYGWAGLFQVKQLSDIALMLDYDQFFHMIYDLKIDEEIVQYFKSDKKRSLFPSKRDTTVWEVGLHFMIFDRNNLERFVSFIHLDSYLTVAEGHAFTWLKNLRNFFPYDIETKQVEDWIYYYEGHDFYNYSPSSYFSMFIVKDDETKETIKLIFYNVQYPQECRISVNGNFINFFMEDYKVLDLGIKEFEVERIEIYTGESVYNITKTVQSIKHNTFRKNE